MTDPGALAVKERWDLFVIRTRIAADIEQARLESLARAARSDRRAGGPRVWLGRRIVAVGTVLVGDAGDTKAQSPGHSN
jgi:hypothetical protein